MRTVSWKIVEKPDVDTRCFVTLEIQGDNTNNWIVSDFDLQFIKSYVGEPEQYPDMKRGNVFRPAAQTYIFDVVMLGNKEGIGVGNKRYQLKKTKTVFLKDFKIPYKIKLQSKNLGVGFDGGWRK